MAQANTKLMRAALKEALEIYEHEYCFADGCIILSSGIPSAGAQWVMDSRVALGLDPITGDRKPPAECEHTSRAIGCPCCTQRALDAYRRA